MANKKICIIYWGLIRGFKLDFVFNSHKKYLYDNLISKNIDFDIFVVTNNVDYDETNINKIPNLKLLKIINVDEIHNLDEYKKAYKNICFTTPGWCDYFHKNLLIVYYNKQQLASIIPNNYYKYISMDIGNLINNFDLSLIDTELNFSSSHEISCGINPRFLIGDYNCIFAELNKFNTILNYDIPLAILNPESFLTTYFGNKQIVIKNTHLIEVLRVRADGTNQNGIKYIC